MRGLIFSLLVLANFAQAQGNLVEETFVSLEQLAKQLNACVVVDSLHPHESIGNFGNWDTIIAIKETEALIERAECGAFDFNVSVSHIQDAGEISKKLPEIVSEVSTAMASRCSNTLAQLSGELTRVPWTNLAIVNGGGDCRRMAFYRRTFVLTYKERNFHLFQGGFVD